MNKQSLIIGIVIAVIVGVGGFYGGTIYAKSQASSAQGSARSGFAGGQAAGGGAARQGGNASGFNRGGMTTGDVVSNDGTTMVVSLASGGSKNILLSSSTQYLVLSKATAGDVKQGTAVIISGTPNADGSITATMVQVRPADLQGIPGFGGGRGQNSTGTPMGGGQPGEARGDR